MQPQRHTILVYSDTPLTYTPEVRTLKSALGPGYYWIRIFRGGGMVEELGGLGPPGFILFYFEHLENISGV